MTTPAPVPVRERILTTLKTLFEAATDIGGEPGLIWERVIRARISDNDRKLKTVLALVEGHERSSPVSLAIEKALDLSIEFEVRAYVGESPATFVNLMLADIEKTLFAHSQLDGLCLHLQVTGSDSEIEAETETVVGGAIYVTVRYRHMYGDPCRLIGE